MNVTKNKITESGLLVNVEGRIDVSNAYVFSNDVIASLNGVLELVIDFSELEYISSAGLRVLLDIARTMENKQGKMKLVNLSPGIREVFKMTGFDKILTVVD